MAQAEFLKSVNLGRIAQKLADFSGLASGEAADWDQLVHDMTPEGR